VSCLRNLAFGRCGNGGVERDNAEGENAEGENAERDNAEGDNAVLVLGDSKELFSLSMLAKFQGARALIWGIHEARKLSRNPPALLVHVNQTLQQSGKTLSV
jgi:hypothetical protein